MENVVDKKGWAVDVVRNSPLAMDACIVRLPTMVIPSNVALIYLPLKGLPQAHSHVLSSPQ
jgi:hypothetical protein